MVIAMQMDTGHAIPVMPSPIASRTDTCSLPLLSSEREFIDYIQRLAWREVQEMAAQGVWNLERVSHMKHPDSQAPSVHQINH